MKKEKYSTILKENLKDSVRYHFTKRYFLFQHDNDPKHTSALVEIRLKDNKISFIVWPAISLFLKT